MKQFAMYLCRWQLSTPILWLAVSHFGADIKGTVIANLIGGAVFYAVDRRIFKR